MRVIYLLTTDRQTVSYYSTIHALELICFNSNTQETMKKQLFPSYSSISTLALKKSRQMFDCNASVYMYFLVYKAQKQRWLYRHGVLEFLFERILLIEFASFQLIHMVWKTKLLVFL